MIKFFFQSQKKRGFDAKMNDKHGIDGLDYMQKMIDTLGYSYLIL